VEQDTKEQDHIEVMKKEPDTEDEVA